MFETRRSARGMSRWVGAIFVLAPVLALWAADEPVPEPDSTYSGRIVYVTTAGETVPLLPDAVLMGSGPGGCELEIQHPSPLNVHADGRFQVRGFEARGGLHGWACYRFRAKGCQDRTLQFGPNPPDATVKMNCADRTPETAAAGGPGSLLSALSVSKGSVQWGGVLLGMSRSEVEAVLHEKLNVRDPEIRPGAPSAVVFLEGRAVQLSFTAREDTATLRGMAIRMTESEAQRGWARESLLSSLEQRRLDATIIYEHAEGPAERYRASVAFEGAAGVKLLVKPEERVAYLGFEDFFVD